MWHLGWHDAHAHLVPTGILEYRTPKYFAVWLDQSTDKFHVMADGDDLLGFVSIEGAAVVKLYVSAEARGRGFARSLLGRAEDLLAQDGVGRAELLCTVGNVRARNFYARAGWKISHTFAAGLWLPTGVSAGDFPVQTHRFTKLLVQPA
jgi:GNAT superfamily N-acetyltransferase